MRMSKWGFLVGCLRAVDCLRAVGCLKAVDCLGGDLNLYLCAWVLNL